VRTLGLESRIVEARPEAKRRFIVRNGELRTVPASPRALPTSNALSVGAKLRLLWEPFASAAPAGEIDETVYDFARRRIGREAADMLVDAAVAGISAGDSRALSVRSQFPLMVEMEREHGSLIRAMLARRKQGKGPGRLLSFEGGLATLIDRLTTALGDCVHANTAVRTIERRPSGWRVVTTSGATFDADHVVLAVSARVAAGIVGDADAALASHLREIPFSGVSVVALAYSLADIPRPLDGYGYLVTKPEGLATLGVVWESSLFPARAPEGMALLRVVLGGARRPGLADMSTEAVGSIARDELRHVMRVTADPVHVWSFRWPGAIAQYTVGHRDRMKAIRDRLATHDGLEVVGTSYDGVSFNHAIAAGRKLGRALAVRCVSHTEAGKLDPAILER